MKYKIVLILFAFLILFIIPPSFSENEESSFVFDDKVYTKNDKIIITGDTVKPNYSLRISVKNPDQMGMAYFTILSNSNSNFLHNFDLSLLGTIGGHNYPERLINGTYTITVENWGVQPTTEKYFNFEFQHIIPSIEINFLLDKEVYEKTDIIIVTGEAPEIFIMKNLKMVVIDPYGEPVINKHTNYLLKFNLLVDENGEFDTRMFTKDFLVSGDYTIQVSGDYMDKTITTTQQFQYDNPDLIDVRVLDNKVQEIDSDINNIKTEQILQKNTIDTLDTKISIQNDTITTQNEIIISIQNSINMIMVFLDFS